MNKHLTLNPIFLLFFLPFFSLAQDSIIIANFLPNQLGDQLFYEQANLNYTFTLHYQDARTISPVALIACNKGQSTQYLETTDKKEGWQIAQIIYNKSRKICERPLNILPAKVETNQHYKDEVTFYNFENGIRKKQGKISTETLVLPLQAVETPLRDFQNCLVLQRSITQRIGKKILTEEWQEWYAKDIGLVKANGHIYSVSPKKGKTLEKEVQLSLDKAIINGKTVLASE